MSSQPSTTADFHQPPSSSMENAMASLTFRSTASHPPPHSTLDQRSSTSARHPISRTQSNTANSAVNLDPTPDDPDTVFIRAPFNNFPGSSERKNGLSYADMAAHPNWFLDVNDFVGPNAVGYPPQLEPPRGWCPTKKKEAKDGWKDGEEPRLRCTLCRRQYAGVNAKSMWRRHVYEKHKIAMANRRDTNNDRPGGRGGRGSNKENPKSSSNTAVKVPEQETGTVNKVLRRVASLEVQSSGSVVVSNEPLGPPVDLAYVKEGDDYYYVPSEEDTSFVEGPSFSSTPPQTPGPSDTAFPAYVIPPESPYNPLMTPAFRHSPARTKQIWRLSPRIRDCTLTMLARGEASPNVRGLDVSPIVLVPASERQKRSIFSPPRKSLLAVSPRRLFQTPREGHSIQSRLDQPGWDAPATPGNSFAGPLLVSPGLVQQTEFEECIKDWIEGSSSTTDACGLAAFASNSTPLRSTPFRPDEDDYFKTCVIASASKHPLSNLTAAYTPHTKMFINGVVTPSKGPDSSPIPSLSAGPSTGDRSGRASPSPPSKSSVLPLTDLLPPLCPTEATEVDMDIDDMPTKPLALGSPARLTPPSWDDVFDQSSSSRPRASTPNFGSISGTFGGFGSLSGLSASGSSRSRKASPSLAAEGRRGRSASNAGASGSSSGQKCSVGLMDAVLSKKSRRRKHSHSEHRVDGEVGVTAMGSPFKMGRKTTRSDFLYSLDGDCEMQDAQPKKRRKTISGRD